MVSDRIPLSVVLRVLDEVRVERVVDPFLDDTVLCRVNGVDDEPCESCQ
jgi:hypothetical protein